MKVLNCTKCGKYLGEIEKGKVLKSATFYCSDCQAALSMAELEIKMRQTTNSTKPFADIFSDLLKGSNPFDKDYKG